MIDLSSGAFVITFLRRRIRWSCFFLLYLSVCSQADLLVCFRCVFVAVLQRYKARFQHHARLRNAT